MPVYNFKSSARLPKMDAQKVGEELESIEVLTPENIVEFAENENTELHKGFTWETHAAAYKWWLQEARLIVNAIVVYEDAPNNEKVEVPVFESVSKEGEKQYIIVADEITDDDIYEQIKGDVLSSISALKNKLYQYAKYRKENAEKAQYHLQLAGEAVKA